MNSDFRAETDAAVVIGGSLAGLLAAHVLADFYERVTIVERDALSAAAESRRGVPQGRHTHGLLAGGRQALEKLFPGISDKFLASGAIPGDIIGDSRWFLEGSYHCRCSSNLIGMLMSRPFLEAMVRGRVRQLPSVDFRDNQELVADLVVDASGRGSHH